jgi:23S rRNA pseudouridine1911/1915/1917 synthase
MDQNHEKGMFVSFCVLESYESMESYLCHVMMYSKQKVKKYFSVQKRKKGISQKQIVTLPLDLANEHCIHPHFEGKKKPYIIIKKDSFLAIHKPEGVHSHSIRYTENNNCLSYLRQENYFSYLDNTFKSHEKSLLYRLDQKTSGVLVLCDHFNDQDYIRKNYKECVLNKTYLALVSGNSPLTGRYQHAWSSSSQNGHKMKIQHLSNKDAEFIGEMNVIQGQYHQESDKTLLTIILNEGHRHQIRIQLSALGYPIIGDDLYGGSKSDRMYLHAWKYELHLQDTHHFFQDNDFSGDLYSL